MISASAQPQAGTSSAGLKTTLLPCASAAAILEAGTAKGVFHGVMRPTTPTGSRVTSTCTPARTEATFSPPPPRRASPAKNLKIWPARATSATASGSVLPTSRASSRPSSSLRASSSAPMRSSTSARRCGVLWLQCTKASLAARIASSTWRRSARAYSATTSLVSDGLTLTPVVALVSQRPLMYWRTLCRSSPWITVALPCLCCYGTGAEV
ncbi:hypothetical protein D9M69_558870 [compost metagenome]